jgi:uncharacterized protein
MKKQVLFIQGGGEGAYQEDKILAENLRDVLGTAFDVRYPKMPDEASPDSGAWKVTIARELAALDGDVVLVGHSVGAFSSCSSTSPRKRWRSLLRGCSLSRRPS